MTPEPLTDYDLAELEAQYAPSEVPPCTVCGAPLEMGSSGGPGEHARWRCSSSEAGIIGETIGSDQWSAAVEHSGASVWYDRKPSDRRVLALIAEVRRLREQAVPGL